MTSIEALPALLTKHNRKGRRISQPRKSGYQFAKKAAASERQDSGTDSLRRWPEKNECELLRDCLHPFTRASVARSVPGAYTTSSRASS